MTPQYTWVLISTTPSFIADPFPDFVASFDTSEQAVDFVTRASLSDYVEWHADSEGSVWHSLPKEPDYTSYHIHKVRHFPKESDG